MNDDWEPLCQEPPKRGKTKPDPKPTGNGEETVVKPDPKQWRGRKVEDEVVKTFETIASTPYVERRALVGDWLHTGAWMQVGVQKIGKSYLLLQLAAAVAEGKPFLDWPCQQAEVLMLATEDDDELLQKRLAQLGIANGPAMPPPKGCNVITGDGLRKLAREWNNPDDEVRESLQGWLQIFLQQHPKIRLVIIDTQFIAETLWFGGVESTLGKKVTETDYLITDAWHRLGRLLDIVIILVGHAGKTKGRAIDNPFEIQNATNTKAAGVAGQIVLWHANPDRTDARNKQCVLSAQGREVPDGEFHLGVHRDQTSRWVSDGPWHIVRQSHLQDEILRSLLDQYEIPGTDSAAWIPARELAEYTGVSRGNVKRTLARLLIKGSVVTVGNRQFRLASRAGKTGGYRLECL